jgi:hypothetical protein
MTDDYITIPRNQFLDLQDRIKELEAQVKELQHRPVGSGFLVTFPNTAAAIGVTSLMNNQPTEYIWCSCGKHYPKGQDHQHKQV